MSRFAIIIEPINANPKNFPANRINKLINRLERHLTNDVGPMLRNDFKKTVQNWKAPPTFEQTVKRPYGTRLQLEIFPKGRGTLKWKRVSLGTGPRIIRAKTPRGMRFQRNYTPKTTPSGRYGGPGKKHGPWVKAFKVKHTIKPRLFATKIKNNRERKIVRDIQGIVRRVGKGSLF